MHAGDIKIVRLDVDVGRVEKVEIHDSIGRAPDVQLAFILHLAIRLSRLGFRACYSLDRPLRQSRRAPTKLPGERLGEPAAKLPRARRPFRECRRAWPVYDCKGTFPITAHQIGDAPWQALSAVCFPRVEKANAGHHHKLTASPQGFLNGTRVEFVCLEARNGLQGLGTIAASDLGRY